VPKNEAGGFTSLRSLRKGPPTPEAALAEIRRIYFKTTKRTIEHDLAHAIELLTSLPTEEDRERARAYMDGLAQLRSEWGGKKKSGRSGRSEKRERRGRVEK
jgi:hypothetical protein